MITASVLTSWVAVAVPPAQSHRAAARPAEYSIEIAQQPLRHTRLLNRDLRLILTADTDRSGRIMGWQIGVYPVSKGGGNLLYDRTARQHGPHPSQFDAWSTAAHYWPTGERRLKVRGHPLLVMAECIKCRITGDGPNATFASGSLRIRWRHDRS